MQTVLPGTAGAREQTRARQPDQQGYVERDGVRVFTQELNRPVDYRPVETDGATRTARMIADVL
jgi:hypothetical protein